MSDWDSVKCCKFSVTAARCVFKLGALRKVLRQGTSVRKKGNIEEKLLERGKGGK